MDNEQSKHSHAHGNGDAHAHSHTHEHPHSHGDEENQSHSHTHTRSSGEDTNKSGDGAARDAAARDAAARDAALLTYMLEHNRSHAQELIEASDRIRSAGHSAVADMISEAVHHFEHGNEHLHKAVELFSKQR